MKSLTFSLWLCAAAAIFLPGKTSAQNDVLLPDLQLGAASNSHLNPNGQPSVLFNLVVKNTGNEPANLANVTYQVYLSKDNVIGNSDDESAGGLVIPADQNSPIPVGGSRTLKNLKFNYGLRDINDFPYFIVHIDYTNVVQELNEANNRSIYKHGIQLLPDLAPVLAANGFVDFRTQGGTMFFKIKNKGTANAPASQCKVTWSTTSGTETAPLLNVPALTPGQEIEVQTPAGPNANCGGNCNFKVICDPNLQIREINEANNTGKGAILG